jgi:hypothetical protein
MTRIIIAKPLPIAHRSARVKRAVQDLRQKRLGERGAFILSPSRKICRVVA